MNLDEAILMELRILGVAVTSSGAEIVDKVLEKTAKLPAKTRKLMDTFGLPTRDLVDLGKGVISFSAANGRMPEVGPLSPRAIGETSYGVKSAVDGVISRFEAAHLSDTPIAKTTFDAAVLDFNASAWNISKAKGVLIFFPGVHEWIFPAKDPKLLRVRRPDIDCEQMFENQLVKGCEVVELLQLSMFCEPDQLVSVIIKMAGRVPSLKGKIALSLALGSWARTLVGGRVSGKKGAIPQLRGQLHIEQIPIEQLMSA